MKQFLVVDDEEDITDLLKDFLEENFNCEVTTANNGKEALDLALTTKFDLILSDFKMPIMNGSQFIQQLRNSGKENTTTPVLFITAYLEDLDHRPNKENKISYLEKPVNFNSILTAIKDLTT